MFVSAYKVSFCFPLFDSYFGVFKLQQHGFQLILCVLIKKNLPNSDLDGKQSDNVKKKKKRIVQNIIICYGYEYCRFKAKAQANQQKSRQIEEKNITSNVLYTQNAI